MTKSLTEQWHDGTLPRGGYYIKLLDWSIKQTDYDNISKTFNTEFFRYNVSVKEVLAPVPSYEKWKTQEDLLLIYKKENKRLKAVAEHCEKVAGQWADKLVDTERKVERLEKQLTIATKALKYYAECKHINLDLISVPDDCADFEVFEDGEHARQALKEIEEVK